jgi:hypothetical protein
MLFWYNSPWKEYFNKKMGCDRIHYRKTFCKYDPYLQINDS